jgi:hypothetical protein
MDALTHGIDPVALTRIVRHACGHPAMTLVSWQVQPVAYANVSRDSRGLYRVFGRAQAEDQTLPWSVILKLFNAPEAQTMDDPAQPFYWRREALAYRSQLLHPADHALDLAAPRCWAVDDRAERQIWLWLEDLSDADDRPWSFERYGLAARHLGRFQGAYLTQPALPAHRWLSRGLIRAWIQDSAGLVGRMEQPDVSNHPLLRGCFAASIVSAALRLWAERERWFAALEALPQTLCHHDFWRNNLFARRDPDGRERTIAIDWEVMGLGAAGEDLGNLLGVSLLNFDLPADHATYLADMLVQQYLAGLAEAGWRGDPQAIRVACAAAAALRCVFSTAGWPIAIVQNERRYVAETEQRWGRPIEQIFEQWAAVSSFLLAQVAQERHVLGPC